MHTAIDYNFPDIVKLILDHFLVSLETPIQQAVEMNRLEIVKMILDHPKCDSSMLVSLDLDNEAKKIVIEHPKMKSP